MTSSAAEKNPEENLESLSGTLKDKFCNWFSSVSITTGNGVTGIILC